jgi:hypothetical protein
VGLNRKTSSMVRQTGYVVGSLGIAVGMLAFIIGLEMQVATARPGGEPTSVNRVLKGDRLPLVPGASTRSLPRVEPALPEGCVAANNAARSVFAAEVPGRCVAAVPTHAALG